MAQSVEAKQTVITEFRRHDNDSGSPGAQVALVGHRRRLLDYLRRTDIDRYRQTIERLGLRK